MKNIFLNCCFYLLSVCVDAQKEIVYAIHGQGSDDRLFKNIHLDTNRFVLKPIMIPMPSRNETMYSLAQKVRTQIDTSQMFSIIGVSLGGMITSELCGMLRPRKAIIISSAGHRAELPRRYRFMKKIPIYRLIPAIFYKWGSFLAQPIVEPDRRLEKATCNAMLAAKKPQFLKRATKLIIRWEKEMKPSQLIHIHGDNDHTLPFKKVVPNIVVEKGSHMMVITKGVEVSLLLNQSLQ
jgi:pimeloyl-ACP methyl ester carboxylesterase